MSKTEERQVEARARAEMIWQALMVLDAKHHEIQERMAQSRRDLDTHDMVCERLRELGLRDRIAALVAIKGIAI